MTDDKMITLFQSWQQDWNKFVRDVLRARLDKEQQNIVTSVQFNPMTTVASGTARGKDFVAACISLAFFYLTPKFNKNGELVENTKVFMTAPTGRQVQNIMTPEVRKLHRAAKVLPGRLVANDIRTSYEEWFLTGFKAGDENLEAWTGLHASHILFVVTEATGLSELVFQGIEGNLQGDSRLLLVWNPNVSTGYAASSMKSERFSKFRLNSLNAENVVKKKQIIPGQVNYEWVKDKVDSWCTPISNLEFNEGEGDFTFENGLYRPNDLFRVKVLGMFPKVSEDVLIPYEWVELANKRWEALKPNRDRILFKEKCRVGIDVAGMGRDSSVLCPRYDYYVDRFDSYQSGGQASHMHIAGMALQYLKQKGAKGFIDTIGEGAGVFSRLREQGMNNAYSCKFSEGAKGLTDITGQYTFANMRAYCYWALRDWLDPKNKTGAAIPPDDRFTEEVTNTLWKFQSNGSIIIEAKEELQKRIKRSPDRADALANTFYPKDYDFVEDSTLMKDFL